MQRLRRKHWVPFYRMMLETILVRAYCNSLLRQFRPTVEACQFLISVKCRRKLSCHRIPARDFASGFVAATFSETELVGLSKTPNLQGQEC